MTSTLAPENRTDKPAGMQLIELRHGGRSYHEIEDELLRQGLTDAEIAHRFGISVSSVKNYREWAGYKPARCLVPAPGQR